ncbi:PREDICTED: regulator of G-protein signaling 9-binding protein [Myotis brandtii]|uniref:regulator of G-protein signaling 9-binding protein n=1 Tax=Myotis brandtii TaxID=109478 RepID=UPI0007042595|nr:PREDICTED: regulator of G-protein signaling 9-binding protein [Myotis brandtii]
MAREECKALLDALNKATACYHHLVLTIGGSADSQNLREELQKTRQKAQELAVATGAPLTTALRDKGMGAEELSVRTLRHEAERNFDADDLRELEREILQVGKMIHDLEMKVNVPRWTVQARQAAGAELLFSAGASSAGFVSVEERTGPCDPSKALAATVFSAVLLAAVALAVCVAKLS